jgi:PPOX class probable F420-dependent enzyme
MRRDVPIEEFLSLLDQPLLAVLATRRADDTTLLSPVWYEWRAGGFDVFTSADDVKVRHLRRDPRASIVVAGDISPLWGVEVRATVAFQPDGARATATRICTRYLGVVRGIQYLASFTGALTVLRFAPGHLRTWDFADETQP